MGLHPTRCRWPGRSLRHEHTVEPSTPRVKGTFRCQAARSMARWFRRSPEAEPPAPLDWEVLLRRRVPGWADLDADERSRLGSLLVEFAAGTKWESARGF